MDIRDSFKMMAFDPGDATGVCYYKYGTFKLDTITKNLIEIAAAINSFKPDVVVVEAFVLYPSKAKHLAWNDMYPAQIIGVIKYVCEVLKIPVIIQQANIKKYVEYDKCNASNDHEKDAFGHAWFYLKRNNKI